MTPSPSRVSITAGGSLFMIEHGWHAYFNIQVRVFQVVFFHMHCQVAFAFAFSVLRLALPFVVWGFAYNSVPWMAWT